MTAISLRPVDLSRDFAEIASLFSLEQEGPNSESQVRLDYENDKDRIFCLSLAEDEDKQILGFNWAQKSRSDGSLAYLYVIVKPEHRTHGAGRMLYEELESKAGSAGIRKLIASVRDNEPASLAFAAHRGFHEKAHDTLLTLDLDSFNAESFHHILRSLEQDGFEFTSMEQLGNTEEAQRKLYMLNNSTSMERILPEGAQFWKSLEEFQRDVCRSEWYIPAGQLVAIHSKSGDWAAMSAVTRFPGSDHAYNLHTAVSSRYHGRNLAKAMLVKAALFARDQLGVKKVVSEENALHADTLAVYRELGYQVMPGMLSLEKALGE